MYMYSKCNFNQLMLDTNGNNGDVLESITISRNNRYNKIKLNYETDGRVLLWCTRFYYDENKELIPIKVRCEVVGDSYERTGTVIIDYPIQYNFDYVAFKIEAEILSSNVTFDLTEMSIASTELEISNQYNLVMNSTNHRDINGNFIDYQTITKNYNLNIVINKSRLEEILNIIEKPFYVVNELNCNIDFSSKELICNEVSTNYVNRAGKYLNLTLSNQSR